VLELLRLNRAIIARLISFLPEHHISLRFPAPTLNPN